MLFTASHTDLYRSDSCTCFRSFTVPGVREMNEGKQRNIACRVGTLEAGTEEIEGVGEKGGSGAGRKSGDGVLIPHHRTLG